MYDGNDMENLQPATGWTIGTLPILVYALDYNDANTVGIATIKGFANSKEVQFNKPVKIKIWPACAPGIYISGISAGYAIKRKMWLRGVNDDIPHYGLKYGLYNITPSFNYRWTVCHKFYLSFRQMY